MLTGAVSTGSIAARCRSPSDGIAAGGPKGHVDDRQVAVGHQRPGIEWRAFAGGLLLAFALPIFYSLLAVLVGNGDLSIDRGSGGFTLLNNLGVQAFAQVVLTVVGLGLAGRGAGISRPLTWLALFVVGFPVIALIWFMAYASFGGAMGSPF